MAHVPATGWTVAAGDPGVFERALVVVRTHGYQVTESDPTTGRIAFNANHRARPTEVIALTVQCYRDGHMDITPSGPRVARDGFGFQVPDAIVAEYRTLVTDMTAEFHGGRSTAD
ncbi:MAG: hypothetical protein U0353_17530 [Sandaracinus sp.]